MSEFEFGDSNHNPLEGRQFEKFNEPEEPEGFFSHSLEAAAKKGISVPDLFASIRGLREVFVNKRIRK